MRGSGVDAKAGENVVRLAPQPNDQDRSSTD